MVSQDLNLIIKAQNLTGQEFAKLQAGLAGVEKEVKKAAAATDEWTNAQQRAAQKMERMHEEALKMNTGFKSSSDQAQQFAQTLGQVSSTATASAAALGLPVGPLTTLNALLPVASLGFTQLTKSAVAFNAASLGVVGAGLAIGAAIGTMLREIPRLGAMVFGIRDIGKSSDDATMAMARWMGLLDNLPPKLSAVEQKATNLAATIKKLAEAADRGEVGPGQQNILDAQDRFYEEQKRAREKAAAERIALAKLAAAELIRIEKQLDDDLLALEKQWTADDQKRMADELKDYQDWKKAQLEIEKQFADDSWQNESDRLTEQRKLLEAYWDEQERQYEAERVQLEEQAWLWANVSDSISVAGDAFVLFGAAADSVLVKLADGLAGLANTASTVFSNLASGNVWGAVTAGIGGVINFIGGLFGGGSSDAEKAAALLEEQTKRMAEFADLLQQIADVKMEFLTKGVQGLAAMFEYAAESATSFERVANKIDKHGQSIKQFIEVSDLSQESLDRLGTIGLAMFEALREAGLSTVEALKQMSPALDKASDAATNAGLDFSGMFGMLVDWRDKILANEDLVNAVEGWSMAFDALYANGMMTVDMYSAMDDQLQEYIADLKEQEFTQEQITAMTMPALYQLWLAQQKYGFALDDSTQAIVDQAAASGAFDDMKDPLAVLVELQELMLLAVSALITAFGADLPAAVQKYIDALNKVPGLPPPPGGPPPPDEDNPWNLPEKAAGAWVPYRPGGYPVIVGESGNEAIIPEGKLAEIVARAVAMAGGSNMGGGNLVVHSKVHIDGREIGKASSKAERRRQLRRHPNSSHTGRW